MVSALEPPETDERLFDLNEHAFDLIEHAVAGNSGDAGDKRFFCHARRLAERTLKFKV